MTTAVFPSTLAGEVRIPSKLPRFAKRLVNALVESRAKSAMQELRRHEAFIADLARRQDHSLLFLIQNNDLPFKI